VTSAKGEREEEEASERGKEDEGKRCLHLNSLFLNPILSRMFLM
jgi:hypothetical protein